MQDVFNESDLWTSEYPQAFRVNAISAMVRAVVDVFGLRYEAIMTGEYHEELVRDSACAASSFVKACKGLLRDTVFRYQDVLRMEVRGREVIHDLMDLFWEGVSDFFEGRKTHTPRSRCPSPRAAEYQAKPDHEIARTMSADIVGASFKKSVDNAQSSMVTIKIENAIT